MKTVNIKRLVFMVIMLLVANSTFSQAVYYAASQGGVVIDCTMMPTGTITTSSYESEDDDYQLPVHIQTNYINTVYCKFVVALEDLNSTNISNTLDWDNAVSGAKDYINSIGTAHDDWRLPNQRELMLMYVLREKIKNAADVGNVAFNEFKEDYSGKDYYYWSSTYTYSTTDYRRYFVFFGNGFTYPLTSGAYHFARAIREVK